MKYRPLIVAGLLLELVALGGIIFFRMTPRTHAGNLANISDTLSNSAPSTAANHTVSFLTLSPVTAGETIKVTFDPTTDAFSGTGNVVTADVQFTGATLVTTCTGSGDHVTLSTSTAVGDHSVIFTVCSGNTVASGTKTIVIGNNRLINPATTQSYIIRVGGTMPDTGDTRVAIIPMVATRAAVDTNFTFTIVGIATGTLINGVTTTGATASGSVAFGTLSPGVPKILGLELQVTTNASNGFTVGIHEDQDLTSSGGSVIHLFSNGNATSTPSAWASPSGIAGQLNTYGHLGVTSNDSDLNGGEFNGSLFAGNFQATSSRIVFSNSGPADGSTQNIGKADIAFKVEISALQAAANDYSNNLIYVATPSF